MRCIEYLDALLSKTIANLRGRNSRSAKAPCSVKVVPAVVQSRAVHTFVVDLLFKTLPRT